MFSCIKYKAGKDKDEESDNPKPNNKDSAKGITKQLKGLALKVTGGSSKQSKLGRKGSSQSQQQQQQRRIPAAESETDNDIEQQTETQTQTQTHVPSYYVGGGSSPSPDDASPWDNSINIDMTTGIGGGYNYSPPGVEITSSHDLGFVAVPRSSPPNANAAAWVEEQEQHQNNNNNNNNNNNGEWLAHVEEGVNIVLLSLPNGGNDLRRIRFSRDMYDRDLAQSWWIANYDRVRELYNVQSFNGQPAFIPPNSRRPIISDHQHQHHHHQEQLRFEQEGPLNRRRQYYQQQFNYELGESSSSSGAPAATLTPSNSFRIDPETSREVEWVEQDEPGVFITITKYADGTRQIRRLRFSRQHFETDDAKNWWLENKERVEAQYL